MDVRGDLLDIAIRRAIVDSPLNRLRDPLIQTLFVIAQIHVEYIIQFPGVLHVRHEGAHGFDASAFHEF